MYALVPGERRLAYIINGEDTKNTQHHDTAQFLGIGKDEEKDESQENDHPYMRVKGDY